MYLYVHHVYTSCICSMLHLFGSNDGVASVIACTCGGEPWDEALGGMCVSLVHVCEVCHVSVYDSSSALLTVRLVRTSSKDRVPHETSMLRVQHGKGNFVFLSA